MAEATEKSPSDAARHEARTIGEEIRDKGAEAAETARETARGYAERARDEAYARGESYRSYAADETGKVASALRRASEDLSSGSPQERFVGQLADNVADAADRMRGMTLSDIARDTTDFARQHPAAFLGGAALLGFATARFLKASARDDTLYLPAADTSGQRSEPMPGGATSSGDTSRQI
jgi:hypothetical protein